MRGRVRVENERESEGGREREESERRVPFVTTRKTPPTLQIHRKTLLTG